MHYVVSNQAKSIINVDKTEITDNHLAGLSNTSSVSISPLPRLSILVYGLCTSVCDCRYISGGVIPGSSVWCTWRDRHVTQAVALPPSRPSRCDIYVSRMRGDVTVSWHFDETRTDGGLFAANLSSVGEHRSTKVWRAVRSIRLLGR